MRPDPTPGLTRTGGIDAARDGGLAHGSERRVADRPTVPGGAHAEAMAPDPTSPDPGSLTVPPLFGWEHIVVVLALAALVAAAWLVIAAARGPVNGRSEWDAWLDARSSRRSYPAPAPQDRAAEWIHPSRLGVPIGAGSAGSEGENPAAGLLGGEESTI